jgi:predicted TIM-barrel fold metal-dependent hydrolase
MAPMARSSRTGAERWDCHVHVFGPAARFPLAQGASYAPRDALPADLQSSMRTLGMSRCVLVQPSVYADDHRCLLAGLDMLGDKALAVAALVNELDESLPRNQSIRGLRLNLYGLKDLSVVKARIAAGARAAAANGWHLELHVRGEWLPALALEKLPVDFVLDHMGRPQRHESPEEIRKLLGTGRCWVKLSGADRVGPHAPAVARTLLAARPDRLIWGSDWPHVPLDHARHEPREVDTPALLAALCEWASEAALAQVLAVNPARLYGRGTC